MKKLLCILLLSALFFSCMESNSKTEAKITTHHGVWMKDYYESFDSVVVTIWVNGEVHSQNVYDEDDLVDDHKIRYLIETEEFNSVKTEALIWDQGRIISKQKDEFTAGNVPEIPQPFSTPECSLLVSYRNNLVFTNGPLPQTELPEQFVFDGDTLPAGVEMKFKVQQVSDKDNDLQSIFWTLHGEEVDFLDSTSYSLEDQEFFFQKTGAFTFAIEVKDAQDLSCISEVTLFLSKGKLVLKEIEHLYDTVLVNTSQNDFSFRVDSDDKAIQIGLDLNDDGEIDPVDSKQTNEDFHIVGGNSEPFQGLFANEATYKITFNSVGEKRIPLLIKNQFSTIKDTLRYTVVEGLTQPTIAEFLELYRTTAQGKLKYTYQDPDSLAVLPGDSLYLYSNYVHNTPDYFPTGKGIPVEFAWDFDGDGNWDEVVNEVDPLLYTNPGNKEQRRLGFQVPPIGTNGIQPVVFQILNDLDFISQDTLFLKIDL